MSDIDSNIANMNRLLKVYETFDAESQTAKVLDAEIDRLADAIDAEVKSEAQPLLEGMHLTAEQVRGLTFALEAVTSVADVSPELRRTPSTPISRLLKVLRALFSADELAWKKCGSTSIERVCQRHLGHSGNHLHYSQSGRGWKSWPTDPAEDRLDIGTADAESLTGWGGSTPAESTENGAKKVRQHPRLWHVQAQGRSSTGNSSAYVDTEKRANYYAKLFLDKGYMAVSVHPPVMDPFIEIATERPM